MSLRWPILLAAAASFGASPAAAQMALIAGPGAEYLGVGVSRTSTGELDDRLAARGYPTFGRTPLAVSLGGHRILASGWMLGAEWHGAIFPSREHAGREVGVGGGYGTLGVGYAVELSPRARVYPRLGLGVAGMGLWIEKPPRSVGFDDVLADPDRYPDRAAGLDSTTTMSAGGAALDVGAGAELLARTRGRGAMIGVRVGYLALPFGSSWRQFERTLTGAPKATLAGPYVRVVIGTGRGR